MSDARYSTRARRKIGKLLLPIKLRVSRLRDDEAPQHRLFGDADDETWLWINTEGYREYPSLRDVLPSLPEEQTQRNFVGVSGDAALQEAYTAYLLWKRLAAQHGRPIGPGSRVLDFGCGWGRIIRFFLREVPGADLLGIDCMPKAIELCRQTNRWCQFQLMPSLPPTDLPDGSFDLIYLFSVFSHLSEEAHDRWLDEFHRVLKPGGLLIATTRPRDFIEKCEASRAEFAAAGEAAADSRYFDNQGFYQAMLGAFPGTGDWLARYDRGEFCFCGTGGGENLTPDFYGEACIPRAYVEARWSGRFRVCDYIDYRACGLNQDVIVAKK